MCATLSPLEEEWNEKVINSRHPRSWVEGGTKYIKLPSIVGSIGSCGPCREDRVGSQSFSLCLVLLCKNVWRGLIWVRLQHYEIKSINPHLMSFL